MLKHLAIIEGKWIDQDANDNDLDEPFMLLSTGRKVLQHQVVGVSWKAHPEHVADAIASLLPQLKPNETTLIYVEDDSDQYYFAVVDITKVSTTEDN